MQRPLVSQPPRPNAPSDIASQQASAAAPGNPKTANSSTSASPEDTAAQHAVQLLGSCLAAHTMRLGLRVGCDVASDMAKAADHFLSDPSGCRSAAWPKRLNL